MVTTLVPAPFIASSLFTNRRRRKSRVWRAMGGRETTRELDSRVVGAASVQRGRWLQAAQPFISLATPYLVLAFNGLSVCHVAVAWVVTKTLGNMFFCSF
jgi:hypothetical protein